METKQKLRKLTVSGNARLADANSNYFIAHMVGSDEQQQANAAHIVKAVNLFDELVSNLAILISKAAVMTDAEKPAESEAIQNAIKVLKRARGN